MFSAELTVDPTDLTTLVIGGAALIGAWGVLWRGLIRPTHRRVRALHDIVARELTPNGGWSVKDSTTKAAGAVGEAVAEARRAAETAAALAAEVASIKAGQEEIQGSQETVFELFDNLVNRKGEEHDEMWEALRRLGVERRQEQRRAADQSKETP